MEKERDRERDRDGERKRNGERGRYIVRERGAEGETVVQRG